MWYFILALAIFGAVQGAPTDDLDDKIMGGRRAGTFDHPYQVSLQEEKGAGMISKFCGGVILNERWVLTAAHCYIDAAPTQRFYINAGVTDAWDFSASSQKIYVSAINTHGGYDPKNVVSHNDIALLHLASPLKFNKYVQAIKLPPSTYKPSGSGTIIGWGATNIKHEESSRYLLSADINVIPQDKCRPYNPTIDDSQVCLGEANSGIAACAGDSGGPFVQVINREPTVVGVTSYGNKLCGTAPAVYTNVVSFLKWIDTTMK